MKNKPNNADFIFWLHNNCYKNAYILIIVRLRITKGLIKFIGGKKLIEKFNN